MKPFTYALGPDRDVREDLVSAYRAAWAHIASPGTWLGGSERVALAAETRAAADCELCRERKAALSPFAVEGEHDRVGAARPGLTDLVHRLTTDASRLSQRYVDGLIEQGITAEEYVEAVGVAVITISIDRFHRALGLPLEPLPEPVAGEPSRARPEDVVEGEAWVPMQSVRAVAAMIGKPAAPNVLRALSLVPAEFQAWRAVSSAQYLDDDHMLRLGSAPHALSRSQIELVAGRVSALNECFY